MALSLNASAYAEARARDRIRIRALPPKTTATRQTGAGQQAKPAATTQQPAAEKIANEFEPVASLGLPAHLLSTDQLMRTHLGTGLDGIRAVLGTAVDWPTEETGIAVAEPELLAQQAAAWSGVARAEVDAAMRLLSLDPQNLPDPVHRYWEIERRSHRLRVRPFPVIDGRILIMPWAAAATQELFSGYFQAGRLPYADPALPPSAATALRKHRQRRNLQLEEEAAAAVWDLGLPHRARWTSKEAHNAGLPDLPGEVDLIVADTARRRLWVCEVKDPEAAFAPAATARHIERFVRRGGHIEKLLAKAHSIAANPSAAAAACGAQGTSWTVIPLMVTRAVEPTAFIDDPQVAFTVLEDLSAVLQAEHEPDHGHVQIGS